VFLRGKAASHFYAIPAERCTKHKDAVAELKKSLCPAAQRETFYTLFESHALRTGEDLGVYKWELEESDNNSQLLTMVAGIAEKQQSFENRLTKAETSKRYSCGSGR
jgi:hypothetical protein